MEICLLLVNGLKTDQFFCGTKISKRHFQFEDVLSDYAIGKWLFPKLLHHATSSLCQNNAIIIQSTRCLSGFVTLNQSRGVS